MTVTTQSQSHLLNRRTVVAGAAALAASGVARAQAAAKGPIVWLDMDQQELDDAYDQSVYAPNQQHVAKRRAAASAHTLDRMPPQRVAYGPTEIEQLDIYKTKRPNAPINVFIHGGAWRNGRSKDHAFPAEMFTAAGAHFVVLDF